MNKLSFLPSYIYSSVFQIMGVSRAEQALPKQIGKYTLVSALGNKRYPYQVGIYQYKKQNVVAKIWSGGKKTIHYAALKHELEVLKILSRATSRLKKLSLVGFTSFVREVETANQLILFTSYQPGEKLSSLPLARQLTFYKKCRDLLVDLTQTLSMDEMGTIGIRGFGYYLLSTPIIATVAIIRRPQMSHILIKAVLKFYAKAIFLNKQSLVLVHGDLHVENIIISKGRVYMLDLEQMRVSFKELEDVTTLASIRNPKGFEAALWGKTNHMREKKLSRFQSILIHANIFNLTANLTKRNVRKYRGLIRKAL